MPRKLAEFKRRVARLEWLRAKKRISPQAAAQAIEKARLNYQSYVIRFENQPRR